MTGIVVIRDRFDALSVRERRMLALLAVAVLAFFVYLLSRGEAEPLAEPTSPPPASPVVAAAPVPAAYVPPPPAVAAPPPAPGGLLLVGLFGGGPGGGAAIVQAADGSQRLVRVGRELQPGMTLRAVGLNHVVVGGAGGDLRLEIGKAGGTPIAAAAPAAPPAAASGQASGPAPDLVRRQTLQYQLGTEPVSIGGVSGYRIKPGQSLPNLERAGLRPGDVIIGVNGGTGFTDERLQELAYEINNAPRTEFEVVRDGRRIRMAVER